MNDVFEDLFVLELANNHWGSLERGLRIVREHAKVVRFSGVKAAIKLQFRDVDRFVHKDFRHRADIRYVKKTLDTRLSKHDQKALVEAIREAGCIPCATPFDEASVDLCQELGLPLLKLASSDINDWFLIERMAATGKPIIASTGGSSQKDVDDLVRYCARRNVPLALNHCVSIYPSSDHELELNQIDYLKRRYPGHVIGFSTHEYTDWRSSMLIAYAKGARTFERHVDVNGDERQVSPYCSLPHQINEWFQAWHKAQEMCGAPGTQKRQPPPKELQYLNDLLRGAYARRDLPQGYEIRQDRIEDDVYLAIPLQPGQLSCRELMAGERLNKPLAQDAPIMLADIN